jgi:succinate dehydrogenase / fumarate reductase, flavoprotein subunit
VRIVTEGAGRGIEDLERYGMQFARESDGRISQRFREPSSSSRTCVALIRHTAAPYPVNGL